MSARLRQLGHRAQMATFLVHLLGGAEEPPTARTSALAVPLW